ncbi:hypothetical protein [Brevibacterium litoralis]|uniref:hypothetical protein n=1 Tax=Brevibacterium litoralis TaxID=3138935 RepID=UPI0032EEAC8A
MDAVPIVVGMMMSLALWFWSVGWLSGRRPDRGVRRQGLGCLLLVAVPVTTVLFVGAVLVLSLVLGETDGYLFEDAASDPKSLFIITCFVPSMVSWGLVWGCISCGDVVRDSDRGRITSRGLVAFFVSCAVLGLGMWAAVVVFGTYTQSARLFLPVSSALASVGVLVFATTSRIVRPDRGEELPTSTFGPPPGTV